MVAPVWAEALLLLLLWVVVLVVAACTLMPVSPRGVERSTSTLMWRLPLEPVGVLADALERAALRVVRLCRY